MSGKTKIRAKITTIVILILYIGTLFVFPTPVKADTTTIVITAINEDGDVIASGKATAGNDLRMNSVPRHAYVEYNISTLPANAVIESVTITYKTGPDAGDNLGDLKLLTVQPSISAAADLFNNIVARPKALENMAYVANTWYTVTVPTATITGYNVSLGWIAFSWFWDAGTTKTIKSIESGSQSYLTITYHLSTDYGPYVFSDTYYENGTLYVPPVNVTAIGTGFTDTFNTSGGITRYYTTQPIMINWDIGSGYTRRYYFNKLFENITVTYPDGTVGTYNFAIRDFTASIGSQDAYLEALRVVAGSEVVIERVGITDTIDAIPLNLVAGKVYRLRIVFADGTTYDFGYYVPGVDGERTLKIDTFTFDSYAHVYNQYVTIGATRPNATHIQITYNDTRADTTSIFAEIRLRNGTQVYNTTIAASNAMIHWYGAVNTTDYVAHVTAVHPAEIDYSRVLPGVEDLPGVPDFSPLGITTELFCTAIVIAVAYTVSQVAPGVGLVAASGVSAAFVYYGMITYLSYTSCIVAGAIGIFIEMGARRN